MIKMIQIVSEQNRIKKKRKKQKMLQINKIKKRNETKTKVEKKHSI